MNLRINLRRLQSNEELLSVTCQQHGRKTQKTLEKSLKPLVLKLWNMVKNVNKKHLLDCRCRKQSKSSTHWQPNLCCWGGNCRFKWKNQQQQQPAHVQLLRKASSVSPTSRRLCFFSLILAHRLIVPAISVNGRPLFELIKTLRWAFSTVPTCRPYMLGDSGSGAPFALQFSCQLLKFHLIARTPAPWVRSSLDLWSRPQVGRDEKCKTNQACSDPLTVVWMGSARAAGH